ncbi:MAG: rhomboid family intramembrane serine protease [Nanoarchaeota archaeon]|nr:rhomboid family intramembrane serine protease [Nanoarchaeota archaeon]
MKVTYLTIFLIILVFGLQQIGVINDSFAFMPAEVLSKPYILVTSIFMHANVHHLLLNSIGLLIFGLIVETEIPKLKWVLLFLISGIIGNIGYMLLSNPFIPALGASGAIFGLMGAAAVLKPKQIVFTQFGPFPLAVAAIIWGITEVISFFGVDNIAQSAHIFGLIGGAFLITMYKKEFNLKGSFAILAIVVAISLLISLFIPKEIYAKTFPCDIEDKIETPTFKEYLFRCNNSYILSIAYPSSSNPDTAYYYNKFPELVTSFYREISGSNGVIEKFEFNTNHSSVYSNGRIGDYEFYALAKNDNYSRIEVIKLFKKQAPLT